MFYIPNWENPVNFAADHLRIPYRFNDGDYTPEQITILNEALQRMSDMLDECIEFFDDTKNKANNLFIKIVSKLMIDFY